MSLQNSLRYEYVTVPRSIESHMKLRASPTSARLAARSRYLYKPNATRAMFAAHFRPLIEEAGKPCLRARPPVHEEGKVFRFAPNIIGRALFETWVPSYQKLYTRRCESDFRVAAAAAEAALAAYKLDRGGKPKALAELVPAYLDRVPDDPYTGEPLAYADGTIHTEGKDADGRVVVP